MIDDYQLRIAELRAGLADDPDRSALLDELEAWADLVLDAAY